MTHENLDPKSITPEYAIDESEEFVEYSRHELPVSIYGEETPELTVKQFDDSYYKEGLGWKVVRDRVVKGTGVAAVFLIVSVAGVKSFRKKYPEQVDTDM